MAETKTILEVLGLIGIENDAAATALLGDAAYTAIKNMDKVELAKIYKNSPTQSNFKKIAGII